MAKNDTSWTALAAGLGTASILLGSLAVGGSVGWLVERYLLPAWRPWLFLAGLLLGLVGATSILVRSAKSRG